MSNRETQAKVLWECGFGAEVGCQNFDEYLASIPEPPDWPDDYKGRFDREILVEGRLPLEKQCSLLGVNCQFIQREEALQDRGRGGADSKPYWIVCHDGKRGRGRPPLESMNIAWAGLSENKPGLTLDDSQLTQGKEVPLSAIEGMALFAQDRAILKSHGLDFAASVVSSVAFDESDLTIASLHLKGEEPYLVSEFAMAEESPDYGTPTRGELRHY